MVPRYIHATESGTMGDSLLQTMSHDQHRVRSRPSRAWWSRRSSGSSVNLTNATAALTMDVISSYALGADIGNLRREDWGADWLDAFRTVGLMRPMGRQFAWFMNSLLNNLPGSGQLDQPDYCAR